MIMMIEHCGLCVDDGSGTATDAMVDGFVDGRSRMRMRGSAQDRIDRHRVIVEVESEKK